MCHIRKSKVFSSIKVLHVCTYLEIDGRRHRGREGKKNHQSRVNALRI
jgi:hypothetical protein